MHISQLKLRNYKSFRELTLDFNENLAVFAGVNGSGKSTVLKALATLLSWPTRRFANPKAQGNAIDFAHDASYGCSESQISVSLKDGDFSYAWSLASTKKGGRWSRNLELSQVNEWANRIQATLLEKSDCSIPLFVYYPVDRSIIDIPLRIRKKHQFQALDALDGNLNSQSRFRVFFEWFRNQEDLENEKRLEEASYRDRSLNAVRKAVSVFLPECTDLRIRRSPLRMVVKKNGSEVFVDDLSDGEKSLLALVGDLARRLSIANENLEDPLCGSGIVLIDEVDLHLHPAWQRSVVAKMQRAFPNCQFFLTTHSPQILGNVPTRNLYLLKPTQDGVEIHQPERSFGLSTSEVVDELMPEDPNIPLSQNETVRQKLVDIYKWIDSEKFEKARKEIKSLKENELKDNRSDIPSLLEAETYLNGMDI